jgi:WD40 repeat protein
LNPKNGKTQFTLKSRKSKLEGLAVSPDGKSFVFQGQIWDTETKKVRKELDKFGEGNVRGLSFSPDGKLLIGIRFTLLNAPGSSRETLALLELWDTDTGEKKSVVWKDRNRAGANSFVAFSPDGKYIAAEGSQHNIMITDLAKLLHKNN